MTFLYIKKMIDFFAVVVNADKSSTNTLKIFTVCNYFYLNFPRNEFMKYKNYGAMP